MNPQKTYLAYEVYSQIHVHIQRGWKKTKGQDREFNQRVLFSCSVYTM